jgi:hypothetical protein
VQTSHRHDVNRWQFDEPYAEWLDKQQSLDPVIKMIQQKSRQWAGFMERLADYRAFLLANGYTHLLEDPDRLIYAQMREVNGVKVGIYGLNSSWSCGRDGERGKLWSAAKWQISHLRSQLDAVDLRIGLIHHPVGWLAEYEEPELSRQIEREFHFQLHGHEHRDWVSQSADVHHTRIAAAACYERSDNKNGYNFVRIDLETGNGEVWLRRYEPDGGDWVPRTVPRRTNNNGLWTLKSCIEVADGEPPDHP